MNKTAIVVATTKSWNISNCRDWEPPGGFEKHLIDVPEKLTYEYLRKLNPRYVFFPHWSWIIPKEIYDNFECIVFHSANLPVGRGGSPIQNHIVRGIYDINVCALRVVADLDAGNVYMRSPINMQYGSAGEIFEKISKICFQMMSEIIKSNPRPKPQIGQPIIWKRRKSEMSRIPESLTGRKLYDFIRMLDADGYPLAFMERNGRRYEFSHATLDSKTVTAKVTIKKIKEEKNEKRRQKILVVSAHPDDEAFGCLGVLLRHLESGDTINFQWFTGGRDEKQLAGMKKLADVFGAEYANEKLADQELDTLPIKKLIGIVERAVKKHKPDIVYTNFIGDLNRDHRLVSEAVMVACRPYRVDSPKEVWMFEVPGTTELGIRPFVADKTVEIDRISKEKNIRLCYEQEMINGRESVEAIERFEKWPRKQA